MKRAMRHLHFALEASVLLAFFTKSYPLFRLEQKSVRYFLTPQFLSAFASFIEKGLVLEKHGVKF